jgi:hypothetical protein
VETSLKNIIGFPVPSPVLLRNIFHSAVLSFTWFNRRGSGHEEHSSLGRISSVVFGGLTSTYIQTRPSALCRPVRSHGVQLLVAVRTDPAIPIPNFDEDAITGGTSGRGEFPAE